MFENKTFEGIYYSRFIASWVSTNGKIYRDEFMDWLRTIEVNGKRMPEEVINDVVEMGTCGKLELEIQARQFKKFK